MNITSLVEMKKNPKIPDIAPGDTVRVSSRIVEGGKERIQVFQGVVIQMRRGGSGANFTVRHVAFGIGVERTFPLYSPLVEKVEVVRHGKVRRAKLYYLRGLSGKKARRKIKRVDRKVKAIAEELMEPEPEEVLEPEAVVAEEPEAEAVSEEGQEAVVEKAPEAVVEEAPASEGTQEPEAAVAIEVAQEEKAEETVREVEAVEEEVKEEEPTLEEELEPIQEEEKAAAPESEQAPVMEKEEETESAIEPAEDQEPDKETP
jgi:large subunit ribosomal protein L19